MCRSTSELPVSGFGAPVWERHLQTGQSPEGFLGDCMGCEEGLREPCSFVLQKRRLREGRGCLVTIFCYLMGGFEESEATLFSDMHNKRIMDNRQLARRQNSDQVLGKEILHQRWWDNGAAAQRAGDTYGFLKTHLLEWKTSKECCNQPQTSSNFKLKFSLIKVYF